MKVLRILNRQKVRAVDRIFFREVGRALLEKLLPRRRLWAGECISLGLAKWRGLNEQAS